MAGLPFDFAPLPHTDIADGRAPGQEHKRKGSRRRDKKVNMTHVWVPGAFKVDHLQPFKLILFPKFYNFSTFILERPILITPERGR